ncbi:GGDEF domain-containing protein [Undibacterium seohonense]|uniref:diguanylate cyclase n=1 Tax=Undibacterium seohonense TaxID=1344950 RepID=A0ABR6X4Q5_9BURK|nr:GGDEF domain-containing protein [Undibacterium seohonense]MBC3807919.1 GGDEF domain-containing protein [Undibacterium seohonense]
MQCKNSIEALTPFLLELFDQSEQLIAIFDSNDLLCYANRAFQAAFFATPNGETTFADMMRANFHATRGSTVSDNDFEVWIASVLSRRGKQEFRAFEADLTDGRWIWMTETLHANGAMLCIASDITCLRQDARELRIDRDKALRASQTDALTGISNRGHIMQLLDIAIRQAASDKRPLCIACLDLDHFKKINDQYGHDIGDLVIRDFAQHLQACTRREDGCGRIGGEEFLLVLPDVSIDTASTIIDRLLETVRSAYPAKEHPTLTYSFSAGIASLCTDESLRSILKRADIALYSAKNLGRDQFQIAPS